MQLASVLPKQIIEMGRVTRGDTTDNLSNHISLSDKNCTTNTISQGLTTTYTIEKTDAKTKDTFSVILSDQLSEKLKLSDNKIEVTVK